MKTVILCGGRGTRLSEETRLRPKPLVNVGDRPILWHIMNIYAQFGFKDFVCALGYMGDEIKDYFYRFYNNSNDFTINLESGKIKYHGASSCDWNVSLIDTGQNTLTGGRLYRLRNFLRNEETFMLTYGDGVSNINVKQLLEFHKDHGKIATVTSVRPIARFGEMQFKDDQVTHFAEKPQTEQGWINGGFFVFNKEIFNYLHSDSDILERTPLEELTKDNQLMAFKHRGFWQCMDTLRDKMHLNEIYQEGNAPWNHIQ